MGLRDLNLPLFATGPTPARQLWFVGDRGYRAGLHWIDQPRSRAARRRADPGSPIQHSSRKAATAGTDEPSLRPAGVRMIGSNGKAPPRIRRRAGSDPRLDHLEAVKPDTEPRPVRCRTRSVMLPDRNPTQAQGSSSTRRGCGRPLRATENLRKKQAGFTRLPAPEVWGLTVIARKLEQRLSFAALVMFLACLGELPTGSGTQLHAPGRTGGKIFSFACRALKVAVVCILPRLLRRLHA